MATRYYLTEGLEEPGWPPLYIKAEIAVPDWALIDDNGQPVTRCEAVAACGADKHGWVEDQFATREELLATEEGQRALEAWRAGDDNGQEETDRRLAAPEMAREIEKAADPQLRTLYETGQLDEAERLRRKRRLRVVVDPQRR